MSRTSSSPDSGTSPLTFADICTMWLCCGELLTKFCHSSAQQRRWDVCFIVELLEKPTFTQTSISSSHRWLRLLPEGRGSLRQLPPCHEDLVDDESASAVTTEQPWKNTSLFLTFNTDKHLAAVCFIPH